jgi:hypothetical protein
MSSREKVAYMKLKMLASDKVTGYQLAKIELFVFRVVAQLG